VADRLVRSLKRLWESEVATASSARWEPVQLRGLTKPVSQCKKGRSLVDWLVAEEGRWRSRW
jgi:hypothetical protein